MTGDSFVPAAVASAAANQDDRTFPTLTPPQVARISAHGRRRTIKRGEVLVEPGDAPVPFFVVLSGSIDVVRPSDGAETLIVRYHAGQFSGEGTQLTGRPSLARMRVAESGEAIEVDRDHLLALVQSDAELSEMLMRAFVLRRLQLIASDLGDVVVVGSL